MSDLEIDVPNNWSVKKAGEGLRFIIPAVDGVEFTPQLLLRVRKGSVYIDDRFGAKFSGYLKKLPEVSSAKNLYIRDPRVMILKNNTKALMYHVDLEVSNRKIVQTHLVFSSKSKHYILSYTDVPEAYETDKDQNYQLAWGLMNSIVIKSGNGPSRELQAYFYFKIILLLVGMLIGAKYLRKYLATDHYIQGAANDILARLPEGVILIEVKAVAMGYQRDFSRPAPVVNQDPILAVQFDESKMIKKTKADEKPASANVSHPTPIQKFNTPHRQATTEQDEPVSEDPDAKSLREVPDVVDDEQNIDKKELISRDEDQWVVDDMSEPVPEMKQYPMRDQDQDQGEQVSMAIENDQGEEKLDEQDRGQKVVAEHKRVI